MRVLCAIGVRAGPELIRRVLAMTPPHPELVLLHVIDTGPRHDLEHLSGPLRHGPRAAPPHAEMLDAAEDAAGRAALDETLQEAQRLGITATIRAERGKPEQVIVAIARDAQAALVAIRAREHAEGHPFQGPASVGHVARFVLDHAPCDVLLLREPVTVP